MIDFITYSIYAERIITYLLGLIERFFDIIFPQLRVVQRSDTYDRLVNAIKENKYYAYSYNPEGYGLSENLIPCGVFIFYFDNSYMLAHSIEGNENRNNTLVIRYINPFKRDMKKLFSIIRTYNSDSSKIRVLSLDRGWLMYNTIEKPTRHINSNLVNVMRKIDRECANKGDTCCILLYGDPGCGKSTNIREFAHKYSYNLCYYKFPQYSRYDYANDISETSENSVILYEDFIRGFIRYCFGNKKHRINTANNTNPANASDSNLANLSDLNMFLDDSSCPNNFSTFLNVLSGILKIRRIHIFTANDIKPLIDDKDFYPMFRRERINYLINLKKNMSFEVTQPHVIGGELKFMPYGALQHVRNGKKRR